MLVASVPQRACYTLERMFKKLYQSPLVRYLIIAIGIVAGELVVFQALYVAVHNYVVATVVSFALAVIVNWFLSRKVVFGASQYHPAKEFLYVMIVSIVGLAIQLAVVYLCVQKLSLYPLLGKIISIGASFFWNYWFRAHFVFSGQPAGSHEEEIERVDTSVF